MRQEQPPPRLAIVMVGLPARGKTAIARKLATYLSWSGHKSRVFNVGNYRRRLLGSNQPHQFFDPDNESGRADRKRMAVEALNDLIKWINEGGQVAIYDATNNTVARRTFVWDHLVAAGIDVLYVESICDDPAVVERNIRGTKLRSPDYTDADPEQAVVDFRQRIAHYERSYEPIDSDNVSYIKTINVGRQIVVNRIDGYLPGRLVFLLMNMHIEPRRIFFTRHGESEFNKTGRIGGDSALSSDGERYATELAKKMVEMSDSAHPPRVVTSTLQRTLLTARHLPWDSVAFRVLDEIEAGTMDGFTYAEIREQWPDEYLARKSDKLRYRYPRGESYEDLIQRV